MTVRAYVTFEDLASFLAPPRFTNVRWFTKDGFRAHERGKPAPYR